MQSIRQTGIFLALASALLLAACSGPSPQATAKTFMQAIASGDAKTAVGLYSFADVDDNKVNLAKKKIALMVGEEHKIIQKRGGLDSIDITKVDKLDDQHVVVHFVEHFGDGSKTKDHLRLVKIDDHWRVGLE